MSHTTLTLLGLCCLSAALLGGQASAARTPAALQGASERADGRAQGQSYWSCSSYAAKALVTALDVQRTADGGLAATVTFAPEVEVDGGSIVIVAGWKGQQAAHEEFNLCELLPCLLKQDIEQTVHLTVPRSRHGVAFPPLPQPWEPCPGPQGPAVIQSATLYAHKFPPPSEATLMEWAVSFYFDELISKATVTVTRTHRSVPYQARTLKACDIVACPLQPGHNDLTYNFVALPDMPLDGVIVQLTSGDQLVFCVWIALRNPPS